MIEYKFKTSGKTRSEHDLLGDKEVPAEALFGVQTLRCIENFDISRNLLGDHPEFVKAFGIVKMGAILANHDLGLVSDEITDAVVAACKELMEGKHTEHFPIDMIQGGAGTSANMNANEVIANRALEIMSIGKCSVCLPSISSLQAATTAFVISSLTRPRSWLARMAPIFTMPKALTNSGWSPSRLRLMSKFSMQRRVCTPKRASAGTSLSPSRSCSERVLPEVLNLYSIIMFEVY